MGVKGKRIAILINDYFEGRELAAPLKSLKENQAEVAIISAGNKNVASMSGSKTDKEFTADLTLGEASSKDYDALILPGGIFNADQLRINAKAQAWVADFIDSGKLVATCAYSPLLLVSVDMVEERKLTSSPTIRDDIRNAGGEWTNRPVVVDKNLITLRNISDIDKFVSSIIEWFEKK